MRGLATGAAALASMLQDVLFDMGALSKRLDTLDKRLEALDQKLDGYIRILGSAQGAGQ